LNARLIARQHLETTSQATRTIRASTAAWPGWVPLLTFPAVTILLRDHMPAWVFMWTLSFAIFLGLKWQTWWQARDHVSHGTGRSLAYLAAWPGMDAETFLNSRNVVPSPQFKEWLWAAVKTLFGILLLWTIARRIPQTQALLRGWVGLFGLIFLLHFGGFHLIALFWQACGIAAQPIMSKPILSKTLSEFWGKRWNLGFRQLAYDLIFRPLHKHIGVAAASLLVFLASGVIHDLVISLPARGGYGLPTAYFILQGLGVTLERSGFGRRIGLQKGIAGWFFMLAIAAGPVFWLFHPPFVLRVIVPFMFAIRAL
jgi:alginate O-acetyltransferase complex protein AlgI